MNTFDLIRDAYDRNMLIYDNRADSGLLSLRLFSLLVTCANYHIKVDRFIVDRHCKVQLNLFYPQLNSIRLKPQYSTLDDYYIMGLPVIFTDGLCDAYQTPYLSYYKDLGGVFVSGYHYPGLIIAAGKDCALLGCYND